MPDWSWLCLGAGVTLAFFAPVILVWRLERRRRARQIRSLFTERLWTEGPLPEGPLLVEGTCQPGDSLRAPLSGEPCLGFSLKVENYVDDTDGGSWWPLAQVSELATLKLDVGGTTLLVETKRARLHLGGPPQIRQEAALGTLSQKLHRRIVTQARERYARLRQDVIPRPGQPVRIEERLLRPDCQALVVGRAERGAPGAALRVRPREDLPLLVYGGTRTKLVKALRKGVQELPEEFG